MEINFIIFLIFLLSISFVLFLVLLLIVFIFILLVFQIINNRNKEEFMEVVLDSERIKIKDIKNFFIKNNFNIIDNQKGFTAEFIFSPFLNNRKTIFNVKYKVIKNNIILIKINMYSLSNNIKWKFTPIIIAASPAQIYGSKIKKELESFLTDYIILPK